MSHFNPSTEIRDPQLKALVLKATRMAANEVEPIEDRRLGPLYGQVRGRAYRLLGASFRVLGGEVGAERKGGCRLFSVNTRTTPRLMPRRARFTWSARGGIGGGVLVDGHTLGIGAEVPVKGAPPENRLLSANVDVGGRHIRGAGRVVRRALGRNRVRLGLEFTPEASEALWIDTLLQGHSPQLVPRSTLPGEQVIELMQSTGYLGLRPGKAITERWLGLDLPGLSWDRVYLDRESRAIGHMSITRAYRRTWTAHQLAARQLHREAAECNRQLYLLSCFVPLLSDGLEAMTIAYFDPTKRWHKNYFDAFVRWMADTDDAVIADIERYELSGGTGFRPGCPDGVEIRRARDSELALVSRWARQTLPELTARALQLEPNMLRSDALHSGYTSSGIERSREVVVLEKDGHVRAAALLERGTGLSLFGLFDRAHVVWVHESRALDNVDRTAFIGWLIDWYRKRGIAQPLLTWVARGPVREVPGIRYAETMGLMTFSARALQHYENFVEFMTNFKRLRWRRHAL